MEITKTVTKYKCDITGVVSDDMDGVVELDIRKNDKYGDTVSRTVHLNTIFVKNITGGYAPNEICAVGLDYDGSIARYMVKNSGTSYWNDCDSGVGKYFSDYFNFIEKFVLDEYGLEIEE